MIKNIIKKKFTETIKNKKLFLIGLLIILAIFALDIYTKRLAFNKIDNIYLKTAGIHSHIKITSFFNIVKVVNTGVSFGILRNLKYGAFVLSIITASIVIFLIYLLLKSKNKYDSITYSIIIAGGLGNLYDRIIFGGVYDFIDLHIGEYHWPAFNIADSVICIGVGLIILKDLINFLKNKIK